MHDNTLHSLEEKLIVSYILSWQRQERCCFASDEFLAEAMGIPEYFVRDLVRGLASRKKIKIAYPQTGTIRMLSVNLLNEPNKCWDDLDIFEL